MLVPDILKLPAKKITAVLLEQHGKDYRKPSADFQSRPHISKKDN